MSNTTFVHTDDSVRSEVQEELRWVPGIESEAIGVGVSNGVVTLSGQVQHLSLRHEAGAAALRVRGVKAVANEIEVVRAGSALTDADIAEAIAHQLRWTATLPEGMVTAEVHDGIVTLRGTAHWEGQRRSAEKQVRGIRGVRWINNEVKLSARANATDTKDRILKALRRNAIIDAQRISVETIGTDVTLEGDVGSWDEKNQAELAAWSSPNVTTVLNRLRVIPRGL